MVDGDGDGGIWDRNGEERGEKEGRRDEERRAGKEGGKKEKRRERGIGCAVRWNCDGGAIGGRRRSREGERKGGQRPIRDGGGKRSFQGNWVSESWAWET